MKKVWITSLDKNPQTISPLLALAKQYGLAADGHFYSDDPAKLAWQPPLEKLLEPAVSLWIIVGSQKPLSAGIGYGLSMMTLSLLQQKNLPPMLWLDPTGTLSSEQLPTLLQHISIVPLQAPTLGAKIVAAANRPSASSESQATASYRIAVHANEGYGTWLEIGPKSEDWDGAMLGVAGAGKIVFQGVGPAGQLPQKTVLEYPQQGLTLMLGEQEYTAWAVRNPIDAETSHYAKIDGVPDSILFGPYAEDEHAEVFIVHMAPAL